MLRRGSLYLSLIATLAISVSLTRAKPNDRSDSDLIRRIDGYQTWKQVNRFDLDVTDRSFKIENSLSIFAGG